MQRDKPTKPSIYIVILITALIIMGTLAIDMIVPLGVAIGVLYAMGILIASHFRDRSVIWGLALFCTVLTLGGAFLSPETVSPGWVVVLKGSVHNTCKK